MLKCFVSDASFSDSPSSIYILLSVNILLASSLGKHTIVEFQLPHRAHEECHEEITIPTIVPVLEYHRRETDVINIYPYQRASISGKATILIEDGCLSLYFRGTDK
jgi:hypothetical protein